MDEIENPPSSSPTKARSSSPPAGDDNASEIWNEVNNQMLLNLKLSEKSSDEILSKMNREVVSDQSKDPLNLDVSLAVESSSPAVAGSSRSNPIQNPGNFNPRVRSTSRGVAITSPPASSVQPVGPSAQVPRWLGVQPNDSTARAHPAVRLPFTDQAVHVRPLYQPVYYYPHGPFHGVQLQRGYLHHQGMLPSAPSFSGWQYPSGYLHHQEMLPPAATFTGSQYPSVYHYHQRMHPQVPTIREPVYSGGARLRGQAHHSRPLVSSGEVIWPRSTGYKMSIRGPRNSSAALMGQRWRASVAVRHSAPDPGLIFIPSTSYDDEPAEPSGFICPVCERDIAFPAEGQVNLPGLVRPTTAVLACGHSFHADCLEGITPEGHSNEPPCSVCTHGRGDEPY